MAYIKAISYLDENESDIFNCGYGYGYSVKEIIDSVKNTMKQFYTYKILEKYK